MLELLLNAVLYGTGMDMTIDELVAAYEKDPELKAALEKARDDMARLKERLGKAAYREWLLGNFVNVEDIRRDV